jgi:hypothetical protein
VVDSGALKLATESASGGEKPVGPREVARFEGEPQAVLRNTSNDIAVAWVLTISAGKQTSATPAAATPSSD